MHSHRNTPSPNPLRPYGIQSDVIDALFKSIVSWLQGEALPWTTSQYITTYPGPMDRTVVELLFYHYDGPPHKEIGGGGEFNHARIHLYDDKCVVSFNGDAKDEGSCINFKYSTRWVDTDPGLLNFIVAFLTVHLTNVFEQDPTKFNGMNKEIEAIKEVLNIAKGVVHGDILA